MAIVNFSLDTGTRQAILTINGVMIPTTDVLVEKYMFEGEEIVRFHYTIEAINENGLKERRQFFLPSPEELASIASDAMDDNGFASKILHNDEKAKADVIDYLKRDRNRR